MKPCGCHNPALKPDGVCGNCNVEWVLTLEDEATLLRIASKWIAEEGYDEPRQRLIRKHGRLRRLDN